MSTYDSTDEPPRWQAAAEAAPPERYEIHVSGHLGSHWAAWFEGMVLTRGADGDTVISGPVADQAALHGLLQKLRDLNVSLRSLGPASPASPGTAPGAPAPSHQPSQPNPGATS